jgi:tRNA nucleotidyltransferase (CCA-adding enzyme)
VLRAARLVATLEFELDPDTARAIEPSLDTYRRVSAERIRDEWNKALKAKRPSRAFRVMHEHGLLAITAPELEALAPREAQPGPNALEQAFARLDRIAPDPELRLAALLAELDPTPSRAASLSDALLTRLRYSNAERKRVTHLVQHPLPAPSELVSDSSLRRWLRRITPEHHADACTLRRAQRHALAAPQSELDTLAALEQRAASELEKKPALTLGALAIDGKRLMSDAGYKPGREIGTTLEALLELVIDDPSANEPEKLLTIARERRDARGG